MLTTVRVRRELVPPRVVAEHDQRFGRSRIGGTAERPAERGPHAQDIEVVHGYECPGDPHRLPPGHRDGVCVLPIPGDSGERVVVVLQFQKVGGREGRSRLIRRRVPDLDEIVGARVGQRPQEHAIDDAEDGGVRSDAKRQRHQDDGSQPGVLRKERSAYRTSLSMDSSLCAVRDAGLAAGAVWRSRAFECA